MALLVRKQYPFVSIPTTARLHTLFRETRLQEYYEPQTTPQEFPGSDLAQDKSPILHSFPFLPHLMDPSLSVSICVHLWFQGLRQERHASHATVATMPIQPSVRKKAPIWMSCSTTPTCEKR